MKIKVILLIIILMMLVGCKLEPIEPTKCEILYIKNYTYVSGGSFFDDGHTEILYNFSYIDNNGEIVFVDDFLPVRSGRNLIQVSTTDEDYYIPEYRELHLTIETLRSLQY